MILLDTNVLSALMRQEPDRQVVAWLDRQPRISVWTTSITVLEIRFGLQIMAAGRRRSSLMAKFDHLLNKILEQRVANFDAAAADQAAGLMAARRLEGRSGELRDAMIAGIALATRGTIATRNLRHFEGLACPVVDPWSVTSSR